VNRRWHFSIFEDEFFIKLKGLLGFEQAVEVLAEAGEMDEPAAVDIAFAPEQH